MSDDAPQNPRLGLPPVRMALRVKGRHAHHGGAHLARQVTSARAPKHLAASTRLTQHAPPPEPGPAPAYAPETPYPVPPFLTEAEEPAIAREAAPDAPSMPGLSDFARDFMFGDPASATTGLT